MHLFREIPSSQVKKIRYMSLDINSGMILDGINNRGAISRIKPKITIDAITKDNSSVISHKIILLLDVAPNG